LEPKPKEPDKFRIERPVPVKSTKYYTNDGFPYASKLFARVVESASTAVSKWVVRVFVENL